jgi:hypothetical protein
MIRMTAIVSSMFLRLLRASIGAAPLLSNRYATSPAVRVTRRFVVAALALVALCLAAEVACAQQPVQQPAATTEKGTTSKIAGFLAGGGVGLLAHESGHLFFDGVFQAHAGVKKVSFHGVPFFAITHDSGLSPRREFIIDSAGFWVQEMTNEVLLTRRPNLRHESAPLTKGVFAFNVLASMAYAGAAFARTGPDERDTRGMAESLRWKEPYVGLLILAPAILDAVRFYHPNARWATWGSRSSKALGVVLVLR